MHDVRSIVLGTDFSRCSRSALAQAVRLACSQGARLSVVHVIDGLVLADLADALEADRDELRTQVLGDAETALAGLLEGLEHPAGLDVEARVGSPAHELLEKVREVSAGLLVLGAHGDFDADRGVGTTAAKCVRGAPVDVLLVQETHAGPFRHVLACVDFSETSRRVVAAAAQAAARDGARLTALHVFFGPWHRLHYGAPTLEAPPRFQAQYTAVLERRLKAFVEPLVEAAAPGTEVEHRLFDSPRHGWGIAELARESGVDLIVLGTQGRTNLRQFLLGSTAERVLREASGSILAVKPDDLRSEDG